MGLNAQESTHYDLLPTADVGEDVVRLWVLDKALARDTSGTRVIGTTLNDFMPLNIKSDAKLRYGTYQLTGPGGRSDDGYRAFLFAKPKTEADLVEPYKTEYDTIEYDWEPVLRVLYALKGRHVDERANTAGTYSLDEIKWKEFYVDRMELIPGLRRYPTKVKKEYWLSPTPFTNLNPRKAVTTVVHYNYKGMSQSIDCLHDDVFIPEPFTEDHVTTDYVTLPEYITRIERVDGFGTPNAQQIPWGNGMLFPRTNMLGWQVHCPVDRAPFQDGVYMRERWTVTPPPLPRAVIL